MADKGKINSTSVLVVDDEALIRLSAIEAFCDAGLQTFEANDAAEAVAILRHEGSRIDVLFTDVNMPGSKDGIELAHYVKEHWPWVGLLVTSGKAVYGAAELPEGCRFLAKPYDALIAIDHIRELAPAGQGVRRNRLEFQR